MDGESVLRWHGPVLALEITVPVTKRIGSGLQAQNVADGSTIRMTLNGSGADDVFWFDPEGAQALVNDVMTDSFASWSRIRRLRTSSYG